MLLTVTSKLAQARAHAIDFITWVGEFGGGVGGIGGEKKIFFSFKLLYIPILAKPSSSSRS